MHRDGLVTQTGCSSVQETVERLENLLASKGIKLFALIDHSGEASSAGMTMLPTQLLIFGAPKTGTPVMLAAPTSAIDLPLKILVWQAQDGATRITYNDPDYLQTRHSIPSDLAETLAGIAALASSIANR